MIRLGFRVVLLDLNLEATLTLKALTAQEAVEVPR